MKIYQTKEVLTYESNEKVATNKKGTLVKSENMQESANRCWGINPIRAKMGTYHLTNSQACLDKATECLQLVHI